VRESAQLEIVAGDEVCMVCFLVTPLFCSGCCGFSMGFFLEIHINFLRRKGSEGWYLKR